MSCEGHDFRVGNSIVKFVSCINRHDSHVISISVFGSFYSLWTSKQVMFREREADRNEDVFLAMYLCPTLPLHDDVLDDDEGERIEFSSDSIEWSPSSLHLHQSFLCPVLSCNWFCDEHESLAQTRLTDYYSICSILSTDSSSSHKIPVLLLITGDSLLFGSGNLFDPSLLSFHENIMVITANFRLGIFGEYCLNLFFRCQLLFW